MSLIKQELPYNKRLKRQVVLYKPDDIKEQMEWFEKNHMSGIFQCPCNEKEIIQVIKDLGLREKIDDKWLDSVISYIKCSKIKDLTGRYAVVEEDATKKEDKVRNKIIHIHPVCYYVSLNTSCIGDDYDSGAMILRIIEGVFPYPIELIRELSERADEYDDLYDMEILEMDECISEENDMELWHSLGEFEYLDGIFDRESWLLDDNTYNKEQILSCKNLRKIAYLTF